MILSVLLPVIVGALLTWFTSAWRHRVGCRRLQADALRAAARTFIRTGQTYLREWTDRRGGAHPRIRGVLDSRDELAVQLRQVSELRPRWILPNRLQELLSGGRLGERMTRSQIWARMSDEEREREGQALRSELSTLDVAVDRIAHALERPGRPHRAMRSHTQVPVVTGGRDNT